MNVGIVTVSDRAFSGEYEDHGGPALQAEADKRKWRVIADAVVPDDREKIKEVITAFEAQGCSLILTTGGTGITERDVTPEAVRDIMRVEIDGFGELMRMRSVEITPNAILSRGLAAVVGNSLVITLPGKPKGAVECLEFVERAIPHTVKLCVGEPTSC